MYQILKDLRDLFLPPTCPVCGGELPEGASTVCNICRMNAPLTYYWRQVDNPVVRKFWGLIPIINASAFLFFVHGNGYRQMIHDFKYHGNWQPAFEMGQWYGAEMARGGLYSDIDIVIPVPLHIRKRLSRGYNQSEYIASGISDSLGIRIDTAAVYRRRHNPSQALKSHRDRWTNVQDIFAIRHSERLRGKHILLVDDVLTTGATITSCAETILKVVPDARISIAVLAVSRHNLETA